MMDNPTTILLAFAAMSICVIIAFAIHEKRSRPNYEGFARGLRRIRDGERHMDPEAPSVLRLLKKDD